MKSPRLVLSHLGLALKQGTVEGKVTFSMQATSLERKVSSISEIVQEIVGLKKRGHQRCNKNMQRRLIS